MVGLAIDGELCIGCGRCVRACATAGIEVIDRVARPTDGCVLCGACVEACPVGAIAIDRGTRGAEGASGYRGVWVVAELDRAGALAQVSLELAGCARALADELGDEVCVLVPVGAPAGAEARDAARQMAEDLVAAGADEVRCCLDGRLGAPDVAVHARWICDLTRRDRPAILLIGATAWGRVLAPAVSVRLETGLTADCTVLGIDPATGLLQQTRPAFGGNLMATIECPAHRPQMATVRPGVFPVPLPAPARPCAIHLDERLSPEAVPRVRELAFEPADAGADIAGAEVLVVVGRGIGSKKNLPLFERLARLLGAELGCTRPLVEAGWLDYAHQVGQTGVSVAPRVLLSFGVSGAIQHLAGIGGAQTVIAVNEDSAAPIFGAARYRVVGDAIEVARQLVEQLEARASGGDAAASA